MTIEIKPFDAAEYLDTPELCAAYLQNILQDAPDHPGMLAHGLGTLAKAKGMQSIAEKTGLGRESLYKALSGTKNPTIDTVMRVIQALGLQIKIVPASVKPVHKKRAVAKVRTTKAIPIVKVKRKPKADLRKTGSD